MVRSLFVASLLANQRKPEEDKNAKEQDEQVPRKKPKMFKIQPNSDSKLSFFVKKKDVEKETCKITKTLVLSRVQAFLPQMQQANQSLERADPAALDIENVDEDEEQYIEMVRRVRLIYVSVRV